MSSLTSRTEKAILNTLSFNKDYPLLKNELYEMLITNESPKRIMRNEFEVTLENLLKKGLVVKSSGYYSMGSSDILNLIITREVQNKYARQKIRNAEKDLSILSKAKFIRFIGVIGGVSAGRCNAVTKTELFVICTKGFEKVSNIAVSGVLRLRRKSGKYIVQKPFCLSESESKINNVLKAYEILMIKPLINNQGTFEKYIHINSWIFDYFVNYPLSKMSDEYRITGKKAMIKAQ